MIEGLEIPVKPGKTKGKTKISPGSITSISPRTPPILSPQHFAPDLDFEGISVTIPTVDHNSGELEKEESKNGDVLVKLMEQARKNLEKLTSHSKQISRQLSQDGSNTPEEDKFMEWAGSPKKGTFRYRRLSFASQGVSSDKDEEESQRIPTSSPPSSDSTFNKPIRRKLYKCPEIEDGPEDEVPFPPSSLGFFSRHGIEPSFSGAFGIAEKINQDRGCIVYPFNHSEEQALFCVFDGHGLNGDLASDFVMKEMVARLEAHPKLNSNPPQALREVYIDVDLAMGDDMEYDKEFNSFVCGTTAVVVYMRGDDMFIANCGDSRAVIGRKKNRLLRSPSAFSSKHQFTAIQLTRDHKPDDSVERARIEKCGGYVTDPPSPGLSGRVWLDIDCSQVGLAMSRSIGDHSVKVFIF